MLLLAVRTKNWGGIPDAALGRAIPLNGPEEPFNPATSPWVEKVGDRPQVSSTTAAQEMLIACSLELIPSLWNAAQHIGSTGNAGCLHSLNPSSWDTLQRQPQATAGMSLTAMPCAAFFAQVYYFHNFLTEPETAHIIRTAAPQASLAVTGCACSVCVCCTLPSRQRLRTTS